MGNNAIRMENWETASNGLSVPSPEKWVETIRWSMMSVLQDASDFLRRMSHARRAGLVYLGDADGVASAVIACNTFERLANIHLATIPLARDHDAHSPATRERLAQEAFEVLLVVGSGSRPGEILPGIPTMVVDYHLPAGRPDATVFLNTYGDRYARSSSMAIYELCASIGDVIDLEWVAAIGAVSALGSRSAHAHPVVQRAFKRFGKNNIIESAVLLNAGYRHAEHRPELAFDVLYRASTPLDIVDGVVDGASELERLRREVQDEL